MKVILALPRDGHDAGATVDVPPAVARQLVYDGHARYPDPERPVSEPAADGGSEPAEPTTASTRRTKKES